jgi:hypothetical protein
LQKEALMLEEGMETETIDLTPTWGELGNTLWRFVVSGETDALKTQHHDYARAFAAAQAFQEIQYTLDDEQMERATAVFHAEMEKQGFPRDGQASQIEEQHA